MRGQFTAALMCATMATGALAQDVVMRRPLPRDAASSPTPVPTPTPTQGQPSDPTQTSWPVQLAIGFCGAIQPGKTAVLCFTMGEHGEIANASDNGLCAAQSPTNPAYIQTAEYYGTAYSIIPQREVVTPRTVAREPIWRDYSGREKL